MWFWCSHCHANREAADDNLATASFGLELVECPECGVTVLASPSRPNMEYMSPAPEPEVELIPPPVEKQRKPSRHLEECEQIALFDRIEAAASTSPCWQMIFAIPNGGMRNRSTYINKRGEKRTFSPEGARLRRQGVRPGVPDLFCAVPRGEYHGLFIEMKSPEGRLSPEQSAWIRGLAARDYCVRVCRSTDEAWTQLCLYLGQEDLI